MKNLLVAAVCLMGLPAGCTEGKDDDLSAQSTQASVGSASADLALPGEPPSDAGMDPSAQPAVSIEYVSEDVARADDAAAQLAATAWASPPEQMRRLFAAGTYVAIVAPLSAETHELAEGQMATTVHFTEFLRIRGRVAPVAVVYPGGRIGDRVHVSSRAGIPLIGSKYLLVASDRLGEWHVVSSLDASDSHHVVVNGTDLTPDDLLIIASSDSEAK